MEQRRREQDDKRVGSSRGMRGCVGAKKKARMGEQKEKRKRKGKRKEEESCEGEREKRRMGLDGRDGTMEGRGRRAVIGRIAGGCWLRGQVKSRQRPRTPTCLLNLPLATTATTATTEYSLTLLIISSYTTPLLWQSNHAASMIETLTYARTFRNPSHAPAQRNAHPAKRIGFACPRSLGKSGGARDQ